MSHPDSFATHSGWKQLLLTLAVGAILAARVPLLWTTGEFVAEDGWVFFADAWNQEFPGSLLQPYAGYFHVLPRFIAELCSGLPIAAQPFAYAGIGLTLNAVILGIFYLPTFRILAPSDLLRAVVVLLLALAPNAQNLGLLLGLHWYLAFAFALLIVAPAPATATGQGLVAIATVSCVWSSPATFALAPFVALAWIRQRDRASRLKFGLMLGTLLVVAAFVLVMRGENPERTALVQAGEFLSAIDRLVLRGWMGVSLLGPRAARLLPPAMLDFFGLAVAAALVIALWRNRRHAWAQATSILLAAALGMLLLSLTRTAYVAELATLTLPVHTRYLTAPTLLLLVGLGVLGAHVLSRRQLGTAMAVLLVLHLSALPGQNHWSRPATRFHLREAIPAIDAFAKESGPASLYIPADIPYWGPVLEKNGGQLVPPEATLAGALMTQAGADGWHVAWLGRFRPLGAGGWVEHETRGRLRFTGIERGRVFFRDDAGRLLFTSPLLSPRFWQLEGLDRWTLLDQ